MTDETRELAALAERVEAATGADRDLDALIAPLLGLTVVDEGHPIGRMCYDNIGAAHLIPRFTSSLDDARKLVPVGFMWRLQSWPDGVNSAILEKNSGDFGAIDARHTETFAVNSALALCAAALLARIALSGTGESR